MANSNLNCFDECVCILMNSAPSSCILLNESLEVITCNQQAVSLLGVNSAQDILKTQVADFLREYQWDAQSSECVEEKIDVVLREGRAQYPSRIHSAKGLLILLQVNCILTVICKKSCFVVHLRVLGADCADCVTFENNRDILQRLQNMADHTAKERMQYMLDSSPLACLIINDDYNLTEVNREFTNLFGLPDKQISLEEFHELSPKYQPDGRLSVEKLMEKHLLTLDIGRTDFEWMHQTLTKDLIPCEVTLVRVKQSDKRLVVVYIRDLRAIKKTSMMMEKLKHLELLAYTDPLTGAYNRRYFMEHAEKELQKSIHDNTPFSVVMVDIDRFKAINDNFGHGTGDEVLKLLVARMRQALRQGTITARYGGEEFIVMLPGVDNKKAEEIAWRINKTIKAPQFDVKDVTITVTVSVGVGFRSGDTISLSDIINNADKALYAAKGSGRNTVVCYSAIS